MTLRELLDRVEPLSVSGSVELPIASVTSDSRLVGAGSLFVAVPGFQFDGASFVDAAVRKGASAIVTEKHGLALPVTTIEVANARVALAEIAANFHGRPADRLSLVGVTGTSGKTTTTKMLESILEQTGEPVGLIGTIEYRAGDRREIADRTTPDATVLQQWFANMVDAGVSRAVMEVSSHALALRRTHGIHFAAAVFTNLSRDHFDFHRDFDDYFATKRMLFDQIDRSRRCAVVNIDDDHGRRLAEELGSAAMTFGRGAECDIRPASGFAPALDGLCGVLATPAGEIRVESPLVGVPNLYNWMGAAGAAIAVGVPAVAIESGIRALASVRGRFESVASPGGPAVLVDYAHKPDALEKLLLAVRSLAEGRRVILVFGCGGDRDKGKRPEMGAIAGRLADLSILTSDNPRSESPEAIVRAIESGIESVEGAKWEVMVDRREAIARAIDVAGSDDVVVIAGKGHENYQVVGDRVIHFDDREEVEGVLKNRRKSG
ncbi:MAG: UDP-N-acetylmuramoyl-L-alanyl-D-glutamate--2,6-diaminopimelate ligase [Thermoanaerobaculia bacterium]|nr:UDP-N-acetylmuramoyl-L-alanyl-D-glutamate--2,6-diaminopimelate ligase [Thermoanaerobaculia bacterium]